MFPVRLQTGSPSFPSKLAPARQFYVRFHKTSHTFLRLSRARGPLLPPVAHRGGVLLRCLGNLKEEFAMKRYWRAMAAAMLLLAAGTRLYGENDPQNQTPRPALSRSEEILDRWNDIGNKLVVMAQDFPEDKYDFKLQKDERTFALNLLHAAALDFVLIRRVSGSNLGPDFGPGDNPTREAFKTKADVVKFVREAVADGAQVIQQDDQVGLAKTSTLFGNRLTHNSSIWTVAIKHSGEHYGQLVVYYRPNNLVPPDSRK